MVNNQSPSGQMLSRFAYPRTSDETTLAIISDTHISTKEEDFQKKNETKKWKMMHCAEERFQHIIEDVNRRGVDGVLFAGDFTQNANKDEYRIVDDILAELEAPLVAIPGNHDLATTFHTHGEPLSVREFETKYTAGGLPFCTRFSGVDIIGLNSHLATDGDPAETFEGEISSKDLRWLDNVLSDVENPLVMVHHDLSATRAFYDRATEQLPLQGGVPKFRNPDSLKAVLTEHEIPLVVSAHLHFPALVKTNGIRELTTPPVCSFPNGYMSLEIDEYGTTVYFHSLINYVESINSFIQGIEKDRVLLAAVQMAQIPFADELADEYNSSHS